MIELAQSTVTDAELGAAIQLIFSLAGFVIGAVMVYFIMRFKHPIKVQVDVNVHDKDGTADANKR